MMNTAIVPKLYCVGAGVGVDVGFWTKVEAAGVMPVGSATAAYVPALACFTAVTAFVKSVPLIESAVALALVAMALSEVPST